MEPILRFESPPVMQQALDVHRQAVTAAPLEFADFYATEWEAVYRPLAVILRDVDLAQEATDEAMTRACQHWPLVRRMGNPPGWVYRVALNWSRSQLRRRAIAARLLPRRIEPVAEPVVEPGLAAALAQLSMRHREVVVLRYLLDWSEREIAAALGVPRGTVKSRLHRALARLRQEMS